MLTRSIAALLGCFWLTAPLFPRQDPATCGTHAAKAAEELFLHRHGAVLRPRSTLLSQTSPALTSRDVGNVAVIEDAGDIVSQNIPFDLDQRTVTFRPLATPSAGYRFETSAASYDEVAAASGTRLSRLADDDTREISLPFPFPFYGKSYRQVFVNSDGNLTFNASDTSTSARSLGRMVSGPPRIAPLFRDLDPTMSPAGVTVFSDAARSVVSWVQVPDFAASGTGPLRTFQVRLYPDGKIEFAYAGAVSVQAVVGISPGDGLGATAVVSFTGGSADAYSGTIAERFSNVREVDIFAAALRFYATHEDAYDYLVFYNNMGVSAASGAVAYEVTARNLHRVGYGDKRVDIGAEFGSPRRLQAVLNMGPLNQYPADPNGRVPARLATGDTPMTVLGHEAGHLFLAFASVRDAGDPYSKPMLKPDGAHWSFNFNSEASLLEGNRIRDNGDGTFTTVATVEGYSPLDQYLMGLRPADQVPPTFLVQDSSLPSWLTPRSGVTLRGARHDVHTDEIVHVEGRRAPDSTVSQRHFRFAFILIVPAGSDPSASDLAQIEMYRRLFPDYYSHYTSDLAYAETDLRAALRLSVWPAAGIVAHRRVFAEVSIEKPVSAPLFVALRPPLGVTFTPMPSAVTIPTGATSASFMLTGLAPGVDDLIATPSDPRFETAYARIQVAGSPAGLRLSQEPATDPVTFRVADLNEVPYAGLSVAASVSAGGTVAPRDGISDADGLVRFEWTPGEDDTPQLAASVEGAQPFDLEGVVNAASYLQGLSPGSFASVFGVRMALGATGAGWLPYPNELAGVKVLWDGKPAGLLYASDRQINFAVPSDAREGVADLAISAPAGAASVARVSVLATSPGIFFDPVTNYGVVLRLGQSLEIYCTGLGTGLPVKAHLGAAELTPTFSGPNAIYPELDQVEVQIPAGLSGEQTLSIEAGGRRSNEVKVRL